MWKFYQIAQNLIRSQKLLDYLKQRIFNTEIDCTVKEAQDKRRWWGKKQTRGRQGVELFAFSLSLNNITGPTKRAQPSLTWGQNNYSTRHAHSTHNRNPKEETKDKACGPRGGPGGSEQQVSAPAGQAGFEWTCLCDCCPPSSGSPAGHSGPHSPDFQKLDRVELQKLTVQGCTLAGLRQIWSPRLCVWSITIYKEEILYRHPDFQLPQEIQKIWKTLQSLERGPVYPFSQGLPSPFASVLVTPNFTSCLLHSFIWPSPPLLAPEFPLMYGFGPPLSSEIF